ncbi:MAG: hypothetical protein JJU28_08780 [Cyclobacteriaceae bacterium]|nr:hypothetical protein [Cyclobacteriaceae bacterium]
MSKYTFSKSVLLVFAVLLASLKLTVHMHFCMDRLVNVSFYTEAQPCIVFEDWENGSCPFHPTEHKKPGCCDDETEVYETEDFLITYPSSFSDAPLLHLIADAGYTAEPVSLLKARHVIINVPESPPPPGGRQICIEVQNFLI